jgi:hypothetical protein
LLKVWVGFNLVDSRRNSGDFEKNIELFGGEIADTNASDLARIDEFLQDFPCIGYWDIC